jgi:hypothetical protein
MADSTLAAIRTKVRRLTLSPSPNQLSDADIDQYVNTFIQYDFPEHLRLFNLRQKYTFYTSPGVDVYQSNEIINDPLFEFQQNFLTVHPPVYVDGVEINMTQSESELFRWYPKNRSDMTLTIGDGVSTTYTGFINSLNSPLSQFNSQNINILRNYVTITSADAVNNAIVMQDTPYNGATGYLYPPNTYPDLTMPPDANNTINYLTGQYTVTFPTAPAAGQNINAHVFYYQPARPTIVMYFQNQFTFRPVPDQAYPVDIEVYVRPTQLLAAGQSPQLEEWWQYIAAMSSKKILEDRRDTDSVNRILPLCKEQELLVLRRTIVQNTNERVATIYTDALNSSSPGYNWGQGTF